MENKELPDPKKRLDCANLYELSPEEQELKENSWDNLSTEDRELGEKILKLIKTEELPYVMSIESGYGMGKTYFVTRLCKRIDKCEGIKSVYIDAFKYDYFSDPLNCITMQVCKQMGWKYPKTLLKRLFKRVKSVGITISYILGIGVNIDTKTDDYIKEFKGFLSEKIKNLTNQRLVLIIDDLDRCKPDFSVKLLEVFKHFFDVEGLFVILSLNPNAFLSSLKSVYGETFGNNKADEEYLSKFINNRISRYTLPLGISEKSIGIYEKIIERYLSKDIEKFFGRQSRKNFNIANIFNDYGLSFRSVKKACENINSSSENIEIKNLILIINLICWRITNNTISILQTNVEERQKLLEECNNIKETNFSEWLYRRGISFYRDYPEFEKSVINISKNLCVNENIALQLAGIYISFIFGELKRKIQFTPRSSDKPSQDNVPF